MSSHSLYQVGPAGELNFSTIIVSVEDWSVSDLGALARAVLESSDEAIMSEVFDQLAQWFGHVKGNFNDSTTYEALAEEPKNYSRRLCYVEIPPELFAPVVTSLAATDLRRGARVMSEQPLSRDLASARAR
ncbi:MAG: hypothetical protein ACYCPT_08835, partial [Acidimicrobiales bacterium]